MTIEKIPCDGCGMIREWNGYECLTLCPCLSPEQEAGCSGRDDEEGDEMSEWISVEERLPENGEMVLTWNGKQRTIDQFCNGKSENFAMSRVIALMSGEDVPLKPTHWMPLPDPPQK